MVCGVVRYEDECSTVRDDTSYYVLHQTGPRRKLLTSQVRLKILSPHVTSGQLVDPCT
ncbi:hypothetical protein RRG08_032388 [Elysia crispata]|uniref:Uncharacterized protein n=1 Tax=Elysia crispata TaxID=231223 RepID=A0AAE1AGX4_9GAST|nr:hypothetical protein RRG08_032388 [Elysia crispata]